MSYSANQYNYATPLSSAASFNSQANGVVDNKYFTLAANVLDGSYSLASGDVGLWGTAVADADGVLGSPFIVTVDEVATLSAVRLIGSVHNYPVAFTVKFYNDNVLLRTITETNNTSPTYVYHFAQTLSITRYEVTVTKISSAGNVAQIYNTYEPSSGAHVDTLNATTTEVSGVSALLELVSSDSLYVLYTEDSQPITTVISRSDTIRAKQDSTSAIRTNIVANDSIKAKHANEAVIVNTIENAGDMLAMKQSNSSHVLNTIDVTADILRTKAVEATSHVLNTIDVTTDRLNAINIEEPTLTNVHTRMKDLSRRIYGKVYITYTDPMLASETEVSSTSEAYNSNKAQVLDGVTSPEYTYFTLYDNDLSGKYVISDEHSQVGWVSKDISGEDGYFATAQQLRVDFSERPVTSFQVMFDTSHGVVPQDFSVKFVHADGSATERFFTDNSEAAVTIQDTISNVSAVVISVTRVSKPGYPAAIIDVPVASTILYVGYKDRSDLISIDMLEELTYEDDVEALGGVSANEVTVVLDNSRKEFNFNNTASPAASQLRRNRKIVPWLGVEIIPGEIEWHCLGTYWAYNWTVPVNGLSATVVGFDTIGLLDITSFTEHHTILGSSIGALIEYVLEDARLMFDFIEYRIDPQLYDITIPYAWFEAGSHTAALRRISKCYPMHIYCDRDGVINAAPQKLQLDYYYDVWADNTNVVDKTYDSLYTTLPNIINVTVSQPTIVANEQLANDTLVFNVTDNPTRTLTFNKPYVSNISVIVNCDSGVTYSYEAYSWGVKFNFSGSGEVRSITCTGDAVDTSNTSMLTWRDDASIRLNGAVTRDIRAEFIQTSQLANILVGRLRSLSELDKYDATVNYRGDISLSINDPILLLDGIAPDNRYNIKRHQLSWNGALTGSAYLNT